jgi:hypothetical protein
VVSIEGQLCTICELSVVGAMLQARSAPLHETSCRGAFLTHILGWRTSFFQIVQCTFFIKEKESFVTRLEREPTDRMH